MRYTFVRHAEGEHNSQRRLSTAPPGPDLTPAGRSQALDLARSLSGSDVTAIYASPMTRTVSTAQAVANLLRLPLLLRESLLEMNVGELEGTPEEVGLRALDRAWDQWLYDGDLSVCSAAGGESGADVLGRFDTLIAELRAGHGKDDHVVVVGHGGFLQLSLPVRCVNLPADFGRINWMRNAQTVQVVDDGYDLRCERWGERPIVEELSAAADD